MSRLGDRQLTQLQEQGWTTVYLPINIPKLLYSLLDIGLTAEDVKLDMVGGLVRVVVTNGKN